MAVVSNTLYMPKTNELRRFGEVSTQRLVLAAWDLLAGGS